MDVLLYWSKKGYSRLADINHLGALRSALRQAMGWKQGQGLFLLEVESGIQKFCNDPEYGKLYSFNAKKDIPKNWNNVKSSLNKDNPAILLTSAYTDDPNNPTDLKYGTHYMCIVGYYEGSLSNNPGFKNHKSKNWLIVHDNVDFTKKSQANPYYIDDEPYIDWGRWATNQDLSIVPGLANIVKPSIISLKINNGDEKTDSLSVTLNNICSGKPTHYIASESSTFDGAQWKKYSQAPGFRLSDKEGKKTIYFMIKSLSGESNKKSDSIVFEEGGTPDEDEGYIYGFNESSGSTFKDRNGSGINGTIHNGAKWVSSPIKDNSGASGHAIQYNGFNQYARLSSHPITNGPFTIMFWAKKIGQGGGSYFIQLVRANAPGTDGAYCIYWLNINTITIVVCTPGTKNWLDFPNAKVNTWTHIALIYNKSSTILYINAIPVRQNPQSGSLNSPNWPLSIGGQGGGIDEGYFNGIIDGLKFKKRALSANEITTIYNREKPN